MKQLSTKSPLLPLLESSKGSTVLNLSVTNSRQVEQTAFEKQISRSIPLGESSVTFQHCEFPIIGSYGADPSVIMAVHNPIYQVSAMAHIDEATNIQEAIRVLTEEVSTITRELYETYKAEAEMIAQSRTGLKALFHTVSQKIGLNKEALPIHPRDPNLPALNVHLSTGSKQLNTTLNELRTHISENSSLVLKSVHQQSGLAIDSRSGVIYTGDFSENHFSSIAPVSMPLPTHIVEDDSKLDMRVSQATAEA